MKISLAADHAGFELKKHLFTVLTDLGYKVDDLGAHQHDKFDDYPDFAQLVAESVQTNTTERGIIICGSGVGMCIVANKFKGIRAATCHDVYSAHQGVEHDGMNVLCIGASIIGEALACEIVRAFLSANFIGAEKFTRRLNKIIAIETKNRL